MRKEAFGKGLQKFTSDAGAEYWRGRFPWNGKEQTFVIGRIEDTSEQEARTKWDAARQQIADGINPNFIKQRARIVRRIAQASSFEATAREWHRKQRNAWTPKTSREVLTRMVTHLFPYIGNMSMSQIDARLILTVIRKIEARGTLVMARKTLRYVNSVFRYAIAEGAVSANAARELGPALEARPQEKHAAAIKLEQLRDFFKKLKKYDGHPATPLAIKLVMLTAVRTNELIGAKWEEIRGDLWTIPESRMKVKKQGDHKVHLSKPALAVLKELKSISGTCEYIFPSPYNDRKPISNNTMLYALYRMGTTVA